MDKKKRHGKKVPGFRVTNLNEHAQAQLLGIDVNSHNQIAGQFIDRTKTG